MDLKWRCFMTRFFNNLKTAEMECENQKTRMFHPRMESRVVKVGNKYFISAHSKGCECKNCPTLQKDGTIQGENR
jgi:hypothetical protein